MTEKIKNDINYFEKNSIKYYSSLSSNDLPIDSEDSFYQLKNFLKNKDIIDTFFVSNILDNKELVMEFINKNKFNLKTMYVFDYYWENSNKDFYNSLLSSKRAYYLFFVLKEDKVINDILENLNSFKEMQIFK